MKPQSGLTMVEVAVTTGIVALIVALAYPVLSTGSDVYGSGTASAELDRTANRVVDAIAEEISLAGRSAIYPDYAEPCGSTYVIFYKNMGYSEGAVQWSALQAYYFRYDPKDVCDGKDNDGDGLTDEGEIVWLRDYGTSKQQRLVVARDVRRFLEGEVPNGKDDNGNGLIDEHGLSIDCAGGIWTIRLTLETSSGKGRKEIHTVETAINPRNE